MSSCVIPHSYSATLHQLQEMFCDPIPAWCDHRSTFPTPDKLGQSCLGMEGGHVEELLQGKSAQARGGGEEGGGGVAPEKLGSLVLA